MTHLDPPNQQAQVLDIPGEFPQQFFIKTIALFDISLLIPHTTHYKPFKLWKIRKLLRGWSKPLP